MDSFPERKVLYRRHIDTYFTNYIYADLFIPLSKLAGKDTGAEMLMYDLKFDKYLASYSGKYFVYSYVMKNDGNTGIYKIKFARRAE